MKKIDFELEVEVDVKGVSLEELAGDGYFKTRANKADIEAFEWLSYRTVSPDRYSIKLAVLARTDGDLDFDKWAKNLNFCPLDDDYQSNKPVKVGSSKVVSYKVTDVR